MFSAEARSTIGGLLSFLTRPLFASTEYASTAKLWHPAAAQARRVALRDSATSVVTDFTREPPVTVTEDCPIDDALREMVTAGVHALLVVREDVVTGLITSYDIQGERPLRLLLSPSRMRPDNIEVRHIMAQWDQVPKLDWSSVSAARVRDVMKVFKSTGATHVVVVENVEPNRAFVRALISRRRLNRQLGLD